jgi:hypothetical protein
MTGTETQKLTITTKEYMANTNNFYMNTIEIIFIIHIKIMELNRN